MTAELRAEKTANKMVAVKVEQKVGPRGYKKAEHWVVAKESQKAVQTATKMACPSVVLRAL
jgi:hypothetical protein